MKFLLWTTGILLTLVLAVSWLLYDDANEAFERQVYPDRAVAKGLKSASPPCMHCARFYRFDASPEVIQQILARRELETIAAIPEEMEQTISLIDEDWWIDSKTLARARKYWALYEPVGEGESRMVLALVDGTTVYFASNGLPPTQQYHKVPLVKQTLGKGIYLRRMR